MKPSLPEQMRQLIRLINVGFLAQARQQLQISEERKNRELDAAEAMLRAAKKTLDDKKQAHQAKLDQDKITAKEKHDRTIAELVKLSERGRKIQEETEAQFKRLGRSLPLNKSYLQVASQIAIANIADVESLLFKANEKCELLKKEQQSGWKVIGSFIFVAALLIFAIGSTFRNSANAFTGTHIGAVILSLLAIGCFIVAHYAKKRINSLFLVIADSLHSVNEILVLLQQKAQDSHRDEVRQAKQETIKSDENAAKHYQKSIQDNGNSVNTTNKQFQKALSDVRNWLQDNMQKGHEVSTRLIEQSSYAGEMWDSHLWSKWQPSITPKFTACFGRLTPPVEDLNSIFRGFDLNFYLPALVPFNEGKCLLLEASGGLKKNATECLQSVLFRLLATIPPGKLNFIFIDPVGLGQSVAAFMKLAEYDESLIKNRAWTEPQHIEQRLSELTEHMENVIQKYLRTDYKNIEEYNAQAGEIAEPYRILVVMDFPTNFSETAARRLVSIASNGPRCGVYTLVMLDTSNKLPHGFNLADLERHSFIIRSQNKEFVWDDNDFRSCKLTLDAPPPDQLANHIVERVGERAKEAQKVEVPFDKLLAQAGLDKKNWWSGSTERSLQVPLGPTGARKLQLLTFGEGLTHHGLIVGRPGSGKTNLMHVIITTLALKYSPNELRLYLVDFKKGVGFKPYADYKLPHAVAIAIESEREFGLSVLQGLDDEMQRRGELFRSEGVEDLSEYRRKTGEVLPRILLVADEFQEFFTHSDNLATQAGTLLDRLTRQGRAFGLHILLGTQTLQGSNSLPKSILNQIALRIALQCSADDSRIVLSDNNSAARLLSRPGEAIYNSANGLVEGNNPFQVALFTDEDRKQHLYAVQMLAKGDANLNGPIIFEGNEPARIESCSVLNNLLSAANYPLPSKAVNAWLGEPTAIREPVAACLRRQSGSNLLIVSRDEEEGLGMLFAAHLSLATQHTPESAKFYVANFVTADTPLAGLPDQVAALVPHTTTVFGRHELPKLFKELLGEVNQRIQTPRGDLPAIYLFVAGLHRARALRQDDGGYNDNGIDANQLFVSLLREGPEAGLHIIAWCDSYANVKRVLPRQIGEFGMRVVTAVSKDDSLALLDDSAASKLEKPHRAVLYDEERPGLLEKLRPYSLPSQDWLKQFQAALSWRTARANNLPDSNVSFSN